MEKQTVKIEQLQQSILLLIHNSSGAHITGKMVMDATQALVILVQCATELGKAQEEKKSLEEQCNSQNLTIKALEEELKK